jgi:hypothetical protein
VVTLARTTEGLLYRSDGSLSGWTGASQWTSVAAARFVAAPAVLISLGAIHNQTKGEPQLKVVGNDWYLIYDNRFTVIAGVLKILTAVQRSADRGVSWYDLGTIDIPSIPGAGFSGGAMYLDPVSGKWFSLGSSGPTLTAGGGLNGPFTFLIYQSSGGIQGPYTLVNTIADISGTWANTSLGAGGLAYDGTNYQVFASAVDVAGTPIIGILQFAAALSATPTQPSPSTPFYDVSVNGPALTDVGMFGVEGCEVAHNGVLDLWVGLIQCAGMDVISVDLSTAINSSSTPTGFSTSAWKHCQWVCPADSKKIISGPSFMVSGSNNAAVCGPNGEMTVISGGQRADAVDVVGHYVDLQPNLATIEPASAVIRYAGASDATYRQLVRSVPHTDITIECGCELTGIKVGGGEFHVVYRSDGVAGNEYRAILGSNTQWRLDKIASGAGSTLVSGTGTQAFGNQGATLGMLHRLKVQVIGNVHTAWLDGELQYTFTDSSVPLASGTSLVLAGVGVNVDIINLSARTSDTITVNGMQPNTSCWLRAACGIPIAPIVANASGVGTISYGHYPLYSLDIAGTDYTVGADSRIWGGDTLQFSGLPTSAPVTPLNFNNI